MTDEKMAAVIATCLEPLAQAHDANLIPGSALDHAYDKTHLRLMKLFDFIQRDAKINTELISLGSQKSMLQK